jgi:GNAT superfamily N-acetyltransferase
VAIEVVPATADRWDDVALILGPRNPDSPACWCLYFRLTSSEFDKVKGRDRPNYLQALCARDESPGLVAYRDGEPVGWCALGPRQEFGRLERSRTIPKVDDRPVWSVVCFVVRPGHRRQGVAGALLGGAVDYARSRGAVALEGYPVDTGGTRISTAFAYVGSTAMFERAGFTRIVETAARSGGMPRWVMRCELG